MEHAEKAIANQDAEFDYSVAAKELAEAAAQLRALRQAKK
jgi:F-type H+-transporting ATPase subunit epsilon